MIDKGNKLSACANKGEDCLRLLKQITTSIPYFWTGEASKAFTNICIQEEKEMAELINLLRGINKNLKAISHDTL